MNGLWMNAVQTYQIVDEDGGNSVLPRYFKGFRDCLSGMGAGHVFHISPSDKGTATLQAADEFSIL
jgi:hypothetical protein